jgi:membrane protease YdiL (CAAX protease family)
MNNPFYNNEEQRLRSFFRILLFIFLFVLAVGVPAFIPVTALEYVLRGVLVLGIYFVVVRYVDRRQWSFSGLKLSKQWWLECLAGAVIAAFVMGLIFLTEWFSGGLEITGFGWERNGSTFWLIPLLVFLVQMMSVGFYEEVMARGYLIPNITEGFTIGNITPQKAAIIAVILSSSLFGLMHAGNPNATLTAVLNIVLAGVMLAIPFVITGRLALPIGLHFGWNFFQGGIFGFRVSGMEFRNSLIQVQQGGPDWWTGGSFGPEAGFIGILGILLILGISLLYLKYSGVEIAFNKLFTDTFKELNNAEQVEN